MYLFAKSLLVKFSRHTLLVGTLALPTLGIAQTITTFLPTTGVAGTTVTISGSGLSTTTSVRLNGLTLPITAKGSLGGSVTVTIPVAASTGKLVLTTTTGSVVSGTQFGVTRSSSGVVFGQSTAKGATFSGIKVAASGNGYYSTPVVADLTNKGRADLLIGNGNGNIEYWQQSTVNGTSYVKIGNLQAAGADIKVTNFAKPTVCDIDGDGLLDLLVGTGTDKHLAHYEQTAANQTTFTLVGNLQSSGAALVTNDYYPRPTIADLDGNGKLDLLIGDYSGIIKRYEAAAVNSASFTAIGNVQADGADLKVDGTSKPLLFDLDGDGLLDFIVGSQNGSVTRYSQTARYATTFKALGSLNTGGSTAISMGTAGNNEGGYAAPTITDIDGNGRLDMLIGNANGTIYRYEQAQATALLASPLPVQLSAFGGQATGAGNLLSWTTASELNSASFAIERSASGSAYTEIGSTAAAGSSTVAHNYQFVDAAAPVGTSYYRLHQIDQDGTSTYSTTVVISRSSTGSAAKAVAYPTVFTTELNVTLPGADAQAATITLLTTEGRTVYTRALQLGTTPQALSELPTLVPGMYLLRVATAAGTTTQRVVRN